MTEKSFALVILNYDVSKQENKDNTRAITKIVTAHTNGNYVYRKINMASRLNPIRQFLSFMHSKIAMALFAIKPATHQVKELPKWQTIEIYQANQPFDTLKINKISSNLYVLALENIHLEGGDISDRTTQALAAFMINKREDKSMADTKTWWQFQHTPIITKKQRTLGFNLYIQSQVSTCLYKKGSDYQVPDLIAFLGFKNQRSMFIKSLNPIALATNIKLIKDEPRFVLPQCTSFIFGK